MEECEQVGQPLLDAAYLLGELLLDRPAHIDEVSLKRVVASVPGFHLHLHDREMIG
jgi:hypothetical protein